MQDLEIKEKVLQEIMDLMEEREGEALKKHPKLVASKVEVEKPVDEEASEEMEVSADMMAKKEDPMSEESEISAEDLQKLLEHFKGL